jgi:hypothetical protein
LAYRKDSKSVLAADTHHRIRSYNFDELSDATIVKVNTEVREKQGPVVGAYVSMVLTAFQVI